MTKAKMSDAEKGFRKFGDLILRQVSDGITVVSVAADRSRPKSIPGQKDPQERLQKAASYARFAAKAQPIYAQLAKVTSKSAYHLARSDWFHPPVIHEVRCGENQILIHASDNIMVAKVVIRIMDGHGRLLEAGQATRQEGDWWEYRPKLKGKIFTVEAWDLAGNVTNIIV